ncbi:MAG: HPF/RaiA family ribosome-associated protein [Holophaga sp.]|nr:HPF/RaiA family ribosome-associated protein [Holophaga sp.]
MVRPDSTLRIKSFGIAPDPFSQSYVHQRVGGKLGKFALHIRGLEIRMKRMGLAGDEQVSCALSVTLDGGTQVAVERSGRVAREAFDHTMGVAERTIRRMLQRLRHQ